MSTSRRQFSVRALTARLADFGGRCACCGQEITAASGLEWDHVVPLELGGDDDLENLQPLTAKCHRSKTQRDVKAIAKAKRVRARHMGVKAAARKQLIPGSRGTAFKKRIDGTVERRK